MSKNVRRNLYIHFVGIISHHQSMCPAALPGLPGLYQRRTGKTGELQRTLFPGIFCAGRRVNHDAGARCADCFFGCFDWQSVIDCDPNCRPDNSYLRHFDAGKYQSFQTAPANQCTFSQTSICECLCLRSVVRSDHAAMLRTTHIGHFCLFLYRCGSYQQIKRVFLVWHRVWSAIIALIADFRCFTALDHTPVCDACQAG